MRVIVDVIENEIGEHVVNVLFPVDQEKIPLNIAAHMLASGISLIIKGCNSSDLGIKDYELMKEIMDHLNSEFSSTKSFEDIEINDEFTSKK